MVVHDGRIEVTVDDQPGPDGKYVVSARQTMPGDIWAQITVQFGGNGNETGLTYRTQDASHQWRVCGSHPAEVPVGVKIVVTNILDVG